MRRVACGLDALSQPGLSLHARSGIQYIHADRQTASLNGGSYRLTRELELAKKLPLSPLDLDLFRPSFPTCTQSCATEYRTATGTIKVSAESAHRASLYAACRALTHTAIGRIVQSESVENREHLAVRERMGSKSRYIRYLSKRRHAEAKIRTEIDLLNAEK